MKKGLLALFLTLLLAGCTTHRVDERILYWQAETSEHLKQGASLVQATNFFKSRGLELKCCINGPDISNAYLAREKHVGRFLLVEYDVVILVSFSSTKEVEKVKVQRWGVGL